MAIQKQWQGNQNHTTGTCSAFISPADDYLNKCLLNHSGVFFFLPVFVFCPPGPELHLVPVPSPPRLKPKPLHHGDKHPGSLSWISRLTYRCVPSTGGLLQAGQQQWAPLFFLNRKSLFKCLFYVQWQHRVFLLCFSPVHATLKSTFSSLVAERDRLRHTIDLHAPQPGQVMGLKTAYASVSVSMTQKSLFRMITPQIPLSPQV